ncbi:MAG: cell shape determination protein CcmA [Lachnospiraceae bacterium]|nr:cell shape determination protein CcmA [Lachnospiraceae bacterium]
MANDAHISGSGTLTSGEYNQIHISGSSRWNGPIHCKEFHVSGACSGSGVLTVTEDMHCSGSLKSDSSLDCGMIRISGSARIEGNVTGHKETHISGSLKCKSLYGGSISISGGLDAQGDVEADSFSFSGVGEIYGLLNAEEVDITVNGVPRVIKIGQIGGSRITIKTEGTAGFLRKLISGRSASAGEAVVGTIEGDDIDLTSTSADVVRGTNITLRSGCRIKRVEYTGNLTIEGDAQVEEQVRV